VEVHRRRNEFEVPALSSPVILAMNVRSSFDSLTARLLRWASEVKPAPKSSIDIVTSEIRQLLDDAPGMFEVGDGAGLGDLDDKGARRQVVLGDQGLYVLREAWLEARRTR
jgi:hypothetical protein